MHIKATQKWLGPVIFFEILLAFWPILYATFLQVSKSIVNMMFYSLFIPCLFCVNIFVSHSFTITSFKIVDNFKSSTFMFCFFLAKTKLQCHHPGFVINNDLSVSQFLPSMYIFLC